MFSSKHNTFSFMLLAIIFLTSYPTWACEPTHKTVFECLHLGEGVKDSQVSDAYRKMKTILQKSPDAPGLKAQKVARLEKLYKQWRESKIPKQCVAKKAVATQIEKLCTTFSQTGVYLRKTARVIKNEAGDEGELDFIPLTPAGPGNEKFRSAVVLKEGKKIYPYSSFSANGFFIDPTKVELGVWAPGDLASPVKQNDLIKQMIKEARASKQFAGHPIKTKYSEVLTEINKLTGVTEYNEALIDYSQEAILALYVEIPVAAGPNDKFGNEEMKAINVIDTVKQAVKGWKRLRDGGREVLIATYDKTKGAIHVLRSIHDYVSDVVNAYCGKQPALRLVEKMRGVRVESKMDAKSCHDLEAVLASSIKTPNIYNAPAPAVECPANCKISR